MIRYRTITVAGRPNPARHTRQDAAVREALREGHPFVERVHVAGRCATHTVTRVVARYDVLFPAPTVLR